MNNLFFPAMQDVAERITRARHFLVALDYDGTLTPIVDDPSRALLPRPTREIIEAMARRKDVDVAIISGRALNDLQQMVGIADLIYAGNHGMEIKGASFSFVEPGASAAKGTLHELGLDLAEMLGHIEGAVVEDKGLTLSVHHRRVAPMDTEEVWRTVLLAIEPLNNQFHITAGAKVYEIRPLVRWDKGAAIGWIKEQLGVPDPMVMYVGDDATDEDVFAVLGGASVTIKVGDSTGTSAAQYLLPGPAEVQGLLRWVHELLQEKASSAAAL